MKNVNLLQNYKQKTLLFIITVEKCLKKRLITNFVINKIYFEAEETCKENMTSKEYLIKFLQKSKILRIAPIIKMRK